MCKYPGQTGGGGERTVCETDMRRLKENLLEENRGTALKGRGGVGRLKKFMGLQKWGGGGRRTHNSNSLS